MGTDVKAEEYPDPCFQKAYEDRGEVERGEVVEIERRLERESEADRLQHEEEAEFESLCDLDCSFLVFNRRALAGGIHRRIVFAVGLRGICHTAARPCE